MAMEFRVHVPAEPLSRWVQHLWVARSGAEDPLIEGDQFPSGGVSVLFNLGAPQALIEPSGATTWFDGAWVAGEREARLRLASPPGSDLIGAQLRPGSAGLLIDAPLSELAGRIVDLPDLWPEAGGVRERLAATAGTGARLALLERELSARLERALSAPRPAPHARSNGLVEHAVRALRRSGPGASIRELADELGMSRRHLARTFAERVGIGPKALHRVLRFQRVIRTADQQVEVRWSSVAAACGYFDQAHLIRDFRRFTGMTPTAYLARRSLDPNFALSEPG